MVSSIRYPFAWHRFERSSPVNWTRQPSSFDTKGGSWRWSGDTLHCKNELHLMHFCNGTYLSQNHEHLRHIKHIRYKITVTCSTSAMPQAHGALYITSAKIGWGAWSASCMGISRYLLSLTRMEWNWAPPQAHGSCTMRLNILNPCAWCEHRFYSVEDSVDFFLTKFQSHEGIFEGIMIVQIQCFSPVPIHAAQLLSAVCPTALSDRGGLVASPGSYLNNRLSDVGDFSLDL